MELSVDIGAALEQTQKVFELQASHRNHLAEHHSRLPAAAFGQGLMGRMSQIAALFDEGQDIQRAHTGRMMDAAQAGAQLLNRMSVADDASATELGGRPARGELR